MWQNFSTPSSIEHTKIKKNDSHPNISSELLIEDEMPNLTIMPNFAYW